MKKSLKAAMVVAMMAGMSLTAYAAQTPSVELGKKLFNDPKLGGATSEKTCASCHPNGTGLEFSSDSPKLAQNINACLTRAMNGSPLPVDSVEMKSLIKYHESLK